MDGRGGREGRKERRGGSGSGEDKVQRVNMEIRSG